MLTTINVLKAMSHLTSDDDQRCRNVAVSPLEGGRVRVEATNGHAALRVDAAPPMPSTDLPLGVEHLDDVSGPVFVDATALRNIVAGKPAKNLEALTSTVAVIPENGRPARVARWNHGWQEIATRPADDTGYKFPNLDRVLPSAEERPLRVVFGIDLLQDLLRAAKELQRDKRAASITFGFTADADHWEHGTYAHPIRIEMHTTDGASVSGAIMSMRP